MVGSCIPVLVVLFWLPYVLICVVTQPCGVQSRAEDYSETLALVRLLNALWKASGPSIYDGGRGYAHFSMFVLESVLAPIGRRQHKYVPIPLSCPLHYPVT